MRALALILAAAAALLATPVALAATPPGAPNCTVFPADNVWNAAISDLRSNSLRPATWTSADAAGLPIFPGLVRYDEMLAGAINHAVRFTLQRTDRSFVWPARHQAGARRDGSLPPMGARFRLRAG